MSECPMCGAAVTVVTGGDGTSHYQPIDSGVLVPSLTVFDRRVLRAIPENPSRAVDVWMVARDLGEIDLRELLRVLRGLQHFGLVYEGWTSKGLWWRSTKGTEALDSDPGG